LSSVRPEADEDDEDERRKQEEAEPNEPGQGPQGGDPAPAALGARLLAERALGSGSLLDLLGRLDLGNVELRSLIRL
jgi:hypothetical protein